MCISLQPGFETDQQYVVSMEYVAGGELFDHVFEKQGLSEEEAKEMFGQIVEAVQYCHEVNRLGSLIVLPWLCMHSIRRY